MNIRCIIGLHDWCTLDVQDTYNLNLYARTGRKIYLRLQVGFVILGKAHKVYKKRVCLRCGKVNDQLTPRLNMISKALNDRDES